MSKKYSLLTLIFAIFLYPNVGCEIQEPSLPYDWLSNFEEVDSGNRNLKEFYYNSSSIPAERTIRIEHSSTNINERTVEFKYDIFIINNYIPREIPLPSGIGDIKPDDFSVDFLEKHMYRDDTVVEIPIKIEEDVDFLYVNEKYKGSLSMDKETYDRMDAESEDREVSINIIHKMLRDKKILYSFEI